LATYYLNDWLALEAKIEHLFDVHAPANPGPYSPCSARTAYPTCPAILLGGAAKLKYLEKTQAIQHLTLLSQLAALTLDDCSEE
jgi:hypothetical protein